MAYLKQKPGSIEDVVAQHQAKYKEQGYQKKFQEALKSTMGGIGSMTPKEKQVFFNKLDEGVSWNNIAAKFREYKKDKADGPYSNVTAQHDTAKEIAALILKYAKENKMKKMDVFNKAKNDFERLIGPDEIWQKTSWHYWDKGRALKEEWQPSTGKHADEKLMKDFIDNGGKVEKVPENKRAYNGNRIKPHLANKKNLDRQKAMTEETITEKDGANTSTRTGSASKGAKKKYRFGYRVAEKQPKGNDVEETVSKFTDQQIKQAYGIANDPRYKGGNYSGAVAAIEKLAKGLSSDPAVANVLKRTNEELQIQEGKWKIQGVCGYKGISGMDRFEMIISASSEKDAERKWEKELDKHRKKRNIGPGGGGSIEDADDIEIDQTTSSKDRVGDISYHMTHSYDPSYGKIKETKDAPKKDVIGKDKSEPEVNLETIENTIRNIWNKAANETTERPDSKLYPTRSEGTFPPCAKDNKKDGKEGTSTKDPAAQEKQILTSQGQINILKTKLENEKNKVIKPVANKETGEVPLTVGIAQKLLRDKAEKKELTLPKNEAVSPFKLKYETLRAKIKEKAEKEKNAKKKGEPARGRTMTGEPASKIETDPQINYNT